VAVERLALGRVDAGGVDADQHHAERGQRSIVSGA
jgi:hypothetical protein